MLSKTVGSLLSGLCGNRNCGHA